MTEIVTALVLTVVALVIMLAPAIIADWVNFEAGLALFGLYFIFFVTWVARWR